MKFLISYILVIIFAIPILTNGVMAVSYLCHHDCEETEMECKKQEICCNDKCDLVKKVTDNTAKDTKQNSLLKKNIDGDNLFLGSINTTLKNQIFEVQKKSNFINRNSFLLKNISYDIFQPPI